MTVDKRQQILDAVLEVLARDGISGVTMRAVSREAGVALGLVNYYFDDKTSLIAASLERIGAQDADLVAGPDDLDPTARLQHALRRVADAEFLQVDYLSLRLQLWALARSNPRFAEINNRTQLRYRDGLRQLISAARPDLTDHDASRRAADILVVQNGIWLTSLLIVDREAIERSIKRCEDIALAT